MSGGGCRPLVCTPLFGAEFSPASKTVAMLARATSLGGLANIINEGLRGLAKKLSGNRRQVFGFGHSGWGRLAAGPALWLAGDGRGFDLGSINPTPNPGSFGLQSVFCQARRTLRLSPKRI
jgi:hypothetical protein